VESLGSEAQSMNKRTKSSPEMFRSNEKSEDPHHHNVDGTTDSPLAFFSSLGPSLKAALRVRQIQMLYPLSAIAYQ
jgi:hypothetical protein